MKKKLQNIISTGLLATIGGVDIDVPIGEKWGSIEDVFTDATSLINILIGLGSAVAVTMIIVGGYTLIFSAGNPDKIEQGSKTLTGAVIGLIIVWGAGIGIKFLLQLLGV